MGLPRFPRGTASLFQWGHLRPVSPGEAPTPKGPCRGCGPTRSLCCHPAMWEAQGRPQAWGQWGEATTATPRRHRRWEPSGWSHVCGWGGAEGQERAGRKGSVRRLAPTPHALPASPVPAGSSPRRPGSPGPPTLLVGEARRSPRQPPDSPRQPPDTRQASRPKCQPADSLPGGRPQGYLGSGRTPETRQGRSLGGRAHAPREGGKPGSRGNRA